MCSSDMRRWLKIVVAVALLGVIGTLYVLGHGKRHVTRYDRPDTRLRVLFAALVAYSQAHKGELPPPTQLRRELVESGYAGAELFELSDLGAGGLYTVGDYSTIGRGSDAFVPTLPLFYANPSGNQACVIFNDNHLDVLEGEPLRRFLDKYGGPAQPIR
jgi:hypothetical protein